MEHELNAQTTAQGNASLKNAPTSILWIFAIGQMGWSLLSGIITNWLVYFYQPAATSGHTFFIPQGSVFIGLTVIGLITAFGRLFDAVTDPLIAASSDRCGHRLGRRIPFLRYSALPFAAVTVLIFCAPVNHESTVNSIWLFVTVILFYLFMTMYCTPFNALIPELGRTQTARINLSTYISITYFVGTCAAYLVPNVASFFEKSLGYENSIRVTIAILSTFAFLCMIIPAFIIDEHLYADTTPSKTKTFASLGKSFKNKQFRIFVGSDILYWIALTIFQTGLPFYITELMHLPDSMTFILFAIMSALSFVFYPIVNLVAKKVGKKKLVVFAFLFFTFAFALTIFCGKFGLPGIAWGIIVAFLASIPMAILGILPQAIIADIAEADSIETKENRSGMFYAARTFAFKLGQSVAMLIFTSLKILGTNGFGLRLSAGVAAVLCCLGGVVLFFYNENKTLKTISDQ
ncbi:MAG: MFS transporter [Treponema sp.]|nr:MFS transporter [Treponema sp.]